MNKRLAKATGELQDKYASGAQSEETSVDGPTGAAYKEVCRVLQNVIPAP